MAVHSLGIIKVTTPGTRVRLTSGQTDPSKRIGAKSIMVVTKEGNVGKVYVGDSSVSKDTAGTTGLGTFCVLLAPTATELHSFSATIDSAPAALNVADWYIDADTANDGVRVLYVVL